MANAISSAVFIGRGVDKVSEGELPRIAAVGGQAVAGLEAWGKYGLWGSKAAGAAVSYVDDLAKSESIWKSMTGKGLKFAQNNVNSIIGVCAGAKILTADDKEKAVCTEIPGFVGMLAAEKQFKKLKNTNTGRQMFSRIAQAGGKHGKLLATVVEGLAFAATSIGGYMLSAKAGECLIEAERSIFSNRKIDEMA